VRFIAYKLQPIGMTPFRWRAIATVLVLGFSVPGCSSQDAGNSCPASKTMSKESAQNLKEENIKNVDVFAVEDSTMPMQQTSFVVRTMLARLFYPVSLESSAHPSADRALCDAIRSFETSAALSPDGVLTFGEFEKLASFANRYGETNINLPSKSVTVFSDFAFAQGTWVISGDQIAAPINHTSISCSKSDSTCTVFDVSFYGNDPSTLSSNREYYAITKWVGKQVEAVNSSDCAETKLAINGETGNVFELNQPIASEKCQGLSRELINVNRPARLITLEDGSKVASEFYRKRIEETLKVLWPTARKAMEAMKQTAK
jgi:hypothetical protein